ncbi:DUF6276 family protein [Halovivax sp.]|uniref:DUF6276 family protein n=1 Tax=Halovivax sp. TaxID=1935978 RepID=UPI0025C09E06|nr:DUF6276 family protein [Halovivax sp.]
MDCSCDVSSIAFPVPADLRECAPGTSEAAAICPRCLAVRPADGGEADPDFSTVSDAFPAGEGGVALALALGLLESLALNRAEIETALEAAERAGADPLLAIDRLLADPNVEPAIDLDRRRVQLESMLY